VYEHGTGKAATYWPFRSIQFPHAANILVASQNFIHCARFSVSFSLSQFE
jgi:hypothetical protein